jgi:hypothetical protein
VSFVYKLLVAPTAYEMLYQQMQAAGDLSVKQTIKRLLMDAAGNEKLVNSAIALAVRRAEMKGAR